MPEKIVAMPLQKALLILAQTHTRDDHEIGFVVCPGAYAHPLSEWSQYQYLEAWRAVRAHLHMEVDPCPSPKKAVRSSAP